MKKIKEYFSEKKNRDKAIFIGVTVLVVGILAYFFYFKGDSEKDNYVDNMGSPESEREKYETKLETIEKKKGENNVGDLQNVDSENVDSIQQAKSQQQLDLLRQNINTQGTVNTTPINTNQAPVYNNPTPYNNPNTNYNNRQYDYYYDTNNKSTPTVATTPTTTTQVVKKEEPKRTWVNPNYKNNSNSSNKTVKVYKAMITGTRKSIITQENNRVNITVSEPFKVNGIEIPKNMVLVAYANFGNQLTLSINSIVYNNKVIPVNIKVLDSQGQEALEVIGGTGADISSEATEEAKSELKTGNSTLDKGVDVLTKKRTKMKARVSSEMVLLQIIN